MDNKRVERLELITKRLMRRAGKTAAALITPYPISSALFGEDLKGPVLRYMFPCDGIIKSGIVRLKENPKSGVMLDIKMFNEMTSESKGFLVSKRFLSVQPDLPVLAGDCLEISIVPGEEPVTEIWIALLWTPTMNNVEVKKFLIEELEDDLQKREKSLTTEAALP